jgi:hypothetical protein
LDRLVSLKPSSNNPAAADREDDDGQEVVGPEYIASAIWQGPKNGYYFGTGKNGTGYYVDNYGREQQQSQKEQLESNSKLSSTRKKKKSVTISEDNNEMKILLEDLEKNSTNTPIVELTAKGIKAAAKSLESIYKKNALKREEFSDQPVRLLAHYFFTHNFCFGRIFVISNFSVADSFVLFYLFFRSVVRAGSVHGK